MRVVITGAAGRIGRLLAPRLEAHAELVLVDVAPNGDGAPGHVCLDVCDQEPLSRICKGADALIHLAGEPAVRAPWEALERPNITGLVATFQAAHEAGVPKVIFASTNHVTGMYDRDRAWPLSVDQAIRPDSLYGATKAFGEAVGRYYADEHEMSVICIRIGWVLEKPHNDVARMMWLSPDDLARLVLGALHSDVRFGIYYGVSNNRMRHWCIDNAREELGYEPQDDAEVYFSGGP